MFRKAGRISSFIAQYIQRFLHTTSCTCCLFSFCTIHILAHIYSYATQYSDSNQTHQLDSVIILMIVFIIQKLFSPSVGINELGQYRPTYRSGKKYFHRFCSKQQWSNKTIRLVFVGVDSLRRELLSPFNDISATKVIICSGNQFNYKLYFILIIIISIFCSIIISQCLSLSLC